MKRIGQLMVFLAVAASAFAQTNVPEIDGSTAVSALALVSGGLLILRGSRRKK